MLTRNLCRIFFPSSIGRGMDTIRIVGIAVAVVALLLSLGIFSTWGVGLTWSVQDYQSPSARLPPSFNRDLCNATEGKQWAFDYHRDAENNVLTEEQCLSAFPRLYKEIDRSVEYRRRVGNLTEDDLDMDWRQHGILRLLIHNNHLYITDTLNVERGHRERYLGTLHSIHAAVSSYPEKLPNVEFTVCVQDNCMFGGKEKEGRTTLAYTRREEHESPWLMPDFGFWGWPAVGMRAYHDLQSVLSVSEPSFADKIPQLVWRGKITPKQPIRDALLAQSNDQPWSDVRALDWHDDDDRDENLISMEDHCNYMFTAMTEGLTWSGRFKMLLNCHSTIVSHELRWIEFYHHLLEGSGDSQNYVVLNRKWEGLPEAMERLLDPSDGYKEALRIADNARRLFQERYLTKAAVSCYWRALFRGWASVQGFEPQLWTGKKDYDVYRVGAASNRREPRGVPYESYILMEALQWEVPARPRKVIVAKGTLYMDGDYPWPGKEEVCGINKDFSKEW